MIISLEENVFSLIHWFDFSKTHIDSIVNNVQETFDVLLTERDEARRNGERDRVLTKINTFQLTNLKNFNDDTQELYEKTFKQHFFDFITKYVNWLKWVLKEILY